MGILSIKTNHACEVILAGYRQTLREGGCPIVLAEEETHLEKLGIAAIKPPKSFWKKLDERPSVSGQLPRHARRALQSAIPTPDLEYRIVRREAGLGSLGQLRFVAIAASRGGCIAREAKNVLPSANMWLNGRKSHRQSYYEEIMKSALRSPDPYQKIVGAWLIRRLSPDSNPIRIEDLGKERNEEVLLKAMGIETANVHLGSRRRVKAILKDLGRRKTSWLRADAKKMAKLVLREWKEYRS